MVTNETIFYQEKEALLAARPFRDHLIPANPRVSVVGNRLKINNDTILVDGTTQVSLGTPLKRIERATLIKRIGLWVVFGLSVSLLVALSWPLRPASFNYVCGLLFYCVIPLGIIPFIFAKLASRKDIKERYHRAEITLVQAGKPTKVFIGAFRRAPGYLSQERDLWARGVSEAERERTYNSRVDFYNGNVQRVEQIAAAISSALANRFAPDDRV